jgi:protein-disulfide isomerase
VILVAVFVMQPQGFGGSLLSPSQAAAKAIDSINTNLLPSGVEATLVNITEQNGVYSMFIQVNNDTGQVYVSKDGKTMFLGAVDLTKAPETTETQAEQTQTTPTPTEVTKSAKPVVQLFVMSYCPYGTQMEKGMLPVVELLGSKIDFSVKFVYYAMHGKTELDEQLKQYCIEKEFNSKYLSYLSCFLEDGNTSRCITKVGIDTTKLNTCIAAADTQFNVTGLYNDQSTWISGQFPQFNVYKTENTKYGVQGSPTLVINDVQVDSGRDSASILKLICSSFTTPPAECNTNLSSTEPSSGFGYSGGTTGSSGSCG